MTVSFRSGPRTVFLPPELVSYRRLMHVSGCTGAGRRETRSRVGHFPIGEVHVFRDHTAGNADLSSRRLGKRRLGIERPERRCGVPTTGLIPAAADEVSALTAAQFSMHAQLYQAVSAQAEAIHDQFVAVLASSAISYAATEAVNAMTAR
jgi:hypothetical protein